LFSYYSLNDWLQEIELDCTSARVCGPYCPSFFFKEKAQLSNCVTLLLERTNVIIVIVDSGHVPVLWKENNRLKERLSRCYATRAAEVDPASIHAG
jgi:hypothetical protein